MNTLHPPALSALANHARTFLRRELRLSNEARPQEQVDRLYREIGASGLFEAHYGLAVLEQDTGMVADTVAKLLYEWDRPDRSPIQIFDSPAGWK